MTTFLDDFIERFWANVDKRGPDECWEWTADLSTAGYGRIYQRLAYKKWKSWGAHRASFIIEHGHLPKHFVCHTCDNPKCVNPRHLFDGSQKDNMQDCKKKGRTRNRPFASGDENPRRKMPHLNKRGEAHSNATLTEAIVSEIYAKRMLGKTAREISADMDMSFQTVLGIIQGLSWTHMLGKNGNPTAQQLRKAGPGKRRKLIPDQVIHIRKLAAKGVSYREIGHKFSVSPAMVCMIHQRKAWPDL